MNSRRVSSSAGEREYMAVIGGGDVPSSRSILRSYGRCGANLSASALLNFFFFFFFVYFYSPRGQSPIIDYN